jgi:predicted DNA-binding transcriptional regulator AlpA
MHGSKPWGSRGHVLPKQPPSLPDAELITQLKSLGAEIDTSLLSKVGLLKTSHVLFLTNQSHSSLYRKMKDGNFPMPYRQAPLSNGIVRRGSGNRWKYEDILAYLAKHKITVG